MSRDLRRIGDPEPDPTSALSDDDSDDGYHGGGGVADALDEISRKFANVSLDHSLGARGDTVDRSQTRITDILQLDVLERLKAFLMASEAAQLQAGNTPQTQAIVDAGFIDTLLLSLGTKGALSLKTQVAWALSNIAGESSALREHLMHQNALGAVVEVLNNVRHNVAAAQDSSQVDQMATIRARGIYADVRVLVWTVANMCRGGFKAKEMWWLYIPAFETLTEMLLLEDIEICTDACWGLSRILSNMHKVDEFLDHLKFSPRLCPRLVECCCSNNINLQTPALRTIINIASGPNQHISTLLEAHPFPTLILFLDNQNSPGLRRDALLTIANIAAGDEKHVACVLDFPGLMDRVEEMVSVVGSEPEGDDIDDEDLGMGTSRRRYRRGRHDDGDEEEEWKVVQEAVWIVSNVTSLGSVQKVGELLHTHPLLPRRLTYLIQHQQTPTMTLIKALDAITNIISRTQPPHLPEFVHLGALETAMLIAWRARFAGGRGAVRGSSGEVNAGDGRRRNPASGWDERQRVNRDGPEKAEPAAAAGAEKGASGEGGKEEERRNVIGRRAGRRCHVGGGGGG
ncbi:LOW QUALITY PROTEIN: armadillo-type protein [Jimgerdemannia flammicorona]|uniref:Armadillo-type protein n=1 Tax=Jimgerdemannia flammicorona TaxID=994334 RepID=A0A433R071_9FUNG|nr:LOW QUALITY PROTEIN: armadillo-type protein [Jimgerdemannia flammicorona]